MRKLWLTLILCATTAVASVGAQTAAAAPSVAILEDCRERAVIVPGVEDLVRPRVPGKFELVRDPLERPLLAVVGSRCERYAIPGEVRARPTTFTFFVALIESPDGEGCLSRWPVLDELKPDALPICNFFNFFAVYDRRSVAKTYRRAFRARGVSFPVHYTRRLTFEAGDFDPARLGEPWRFRAGGRTPSHFEIDAIARELPFAGPETISFWAVGPSGLVGGRFEVGDFSPGLMDATLRAAPGSQMAALLGSETPTPLLGLANHYSHAEGTLLDPGG